MSHRVARGPISTPASRFGAKLARERKRQCKSMEVLARIAGTHASEISRLERGLRDPRLSTIVGLARALDVPLSELVDDGTGNSRSTEPENRSGDQVVGVRTDPVAVERVETVRLGRDLGLAGAGPDKVAGDRP